jgi:hypothetical protein
MDSSIPGGEAGSPRHDEGALGMHGKSCAHRVTGAKSRATQTSTPVCRAPSGMTRKNGKMYLRSLPKAVPGLGADLAAVVGSRSKG